MQNNNKKNTWFLERYGEIMETHIDFLYCVNDYIACVVRKSMSGAERVEVVLIFGGNIISIAIAGSFSFYPPFSV